MTDRELLEFAAKAAGIEFVSMDNWPHQDGCRFWRDGDSCDCGAAWNPLERDDDAFRLMVKLDMNVFQAAKSAYALPADDDGTYEEQVRYIDAGSDPYAATRRAIVRAAAAIGKEMP